MEPWLFVLSLDHCHMFYFGSKEEKKFQNCLRSNLKMTIINNLKTKDCLSKFWKTSSWENDQMSMSL